MPWQEVSIMEQRLEVVKLALKEGANISELALRAGVSRPTLYKWVTRFRGKGVLGLNDLSRRPHHSSKRTPPEVEDAIVAMRKEHPAWGARTILHRLKQLGMEDLPAPSTVHTILKRREQISPESSQQHLPWHRFEYKTPNELWQMDFKGHFALKEGRCHPLTMLDDHSRFALTVQACKDEKSPTVQGYLMEVFRRFGMPERLLMDNGGPWGHGGAASHTQLSLWLMRLGLKVLHGRPRHPQTQGKLERFHRTLKAEALQGRLFEDLLQAQKHLDEFRQIYNHERPHQALDFAVPADRYTMSTRAYPEALPPIEYGPDDAVRKVCHKGLISFHGSQFRIGKAFRGQPVALRPTTDPDRFHVVYCQTHVTQINLNQPKDQKPCVNDVSEHL